MLHDQTDRALADSQGQIRQLEIELANSQDRIRNIDKERGKLDQEVAMLKQDILIMKGNLAQLDQEKDALVVSFINHMHIETKNPKFCLLILNSSSFCRL